MSFDSMSRELSGAVPKLPPEYCDTLINRAWHTIRERNLWSFLLFEGQWVAPPLFSSGTVSVTQGSATATLDATAIAALNAAQLAQPYSLITQRQFRIAAGGIYNIWAYDAVAGTLSLDRPYGEATSAAASFRIFQCYFIPAVNAGAASTPIADFKTWISVRNLQTFSSLYCDRLTRADLDATDPQRLWVNWPSDVVPYIRDANPLSATLGMFQFELWGPALSNYTFQLFGIRRGVDLSSPDDELPAAVGEDCVMALARAGAYEWAEANKDISGGRNSGPDFKFLIGKTMKEYDDLLRLYRQQDRETCDQWFSVRRSAIPGNAWAAVYNSAAGVAFAGSPF